MDLSGLPDDTLTPGLDLAGLPDTNAKALREQYRTTTSTPDEAAKVIDITKRTGLPKPVVERNRQEAEKQALEPDWDGLEATAPITVRELAANTKLFELANDDTENAAQIERTLNRRSEGKIGGPAFVRSPDRLAPSTGPEASFSSIAYGLYNSFAQGSERARQGVRMQFADAFGLDEMFQDALRKRDQAQSRQDLTTPEFETSTAKGIYGGGASTLQNLPGLAASIITRSPAPALAAAGVQTELDAYGKYRSRGASGGEALLGAAGEGAVEVATELIPLRTMLGAFGQPGKTFAKEFLKSQVQEQFGEQAATILQDAIDTAVANPNKTWGDYLKERPDAAYQTALATLVQSGVMTAGHVAVTKLAGDEAKAAGATKDAEALAQLSQLAAASKLRARDPQTFQDFVAAANEDGAVQDIYIDARTLQQAGIDPQVLAQASPSVAAQIEEALATGSDIVIPTAEYAARIAGTDLDPVLTPHLRTSEDALSLIEAQTFYQGQAEEFQKAAAKVMEEKAADTAWQQSAKAVETKLFDELKNAARFTDDVNSAYSTLMRDFYVATASRLGITPEEMFSRYPIKVAAERMAGGASRMEQRGEGVWYHGTTSDVEKFSRVEGGNMWGSGYYLTDNPDTASGYATGTAGNRIAPQGNAGPNVMPVRVGKGELFDMAAPLEAKTLKRVEKALGQKLKDYTYAGMKNRDLRQVLFEQFTDQNGANEVLRNAGFIGLVEANPTAGPGRTLMVFDPKNITSDITGGVMGQAPNPIQKLFQAVTDALGITQPAQEQPAPQPVEQGTPGEPLDMSQFFQGDKPDLIVQHNLSAENLLHAVKMGGIPVPSLAITKKDHPLTGFGEITLLGSKDLVDPKGYAGTKVFGADIYSPRYPSVEYQFTANMKKLAEARLKDAIKATGVNLEWDELERNGPRALERSDPLMWQFLKDRDIEPTIVRKEAKPLPPALQPFVNDNRHAFELANDPAFVEASYKAHEEAIKAAYDTDPNAAKYAADEVASLKKNAEERGVDYLVKQHANDVIAYQRTQREAGQIDYNATEAAMAAQIWDAGLRDEFADYGREFFADINPNERIFQGYTNNGRRYVAHTLENVVKILKKELRGGEGFNYGVGSIRSKFTPQFKSIKQIREAKDRLMDKAAFEAVKDEIDKEFFAVVEELRSFHPVGKDFGFGDTVSSMMYDAATMGIPRALKENGFSEVPVEKQQEIAEFLGKLRDLPTEYFEAKILRDVDLTEFSGAVVPEGVNPKVIEALNSRGVKDIRYYKKGDEADRRAKIGEFENLFFQGNRGEIAFGKDITKTPSVITLFNNADLSTFLHEMGHFQLEVLANIASQPNAPAEIVQDMEKVLAWFGITGSEEVGGGETAGSLGQPAYHGSPYRFDKFSLEHLGKGEGAQAYGWGLYFADKKGIAEHYRQALSKTTPAHNTLDGKRITKKVLEELQNSDDYAVRSFFNSKEGKRAAGITNIAKAVDDAIESAQEVRDDYQGRLDKHLANPPIASTYGPVDYQTWIAAEDRRIAGLQALKARLGFNKESKSGQLYEVNIPDDGNYLLWDKPLSAQPEAVRKALEQAGFTDNKADVTAFDDALLAALQTDEDVAVPKQPADPSGESIYQRLTKQQGSDEAASKYLNTLGIAGIKYLDGTSRTDGEGTFNYVIFDDSAVEILTTFYQGDQPATPDPASLPKRRTALEVWQAMSLEEKRPYHEQFARGFEAYLFEGKAPNPELNSLFRRFADWLKSVYKSIKALNVEISPELRGVFDRMIATEDAIKAAEEQRGYTAQFAEDAEAQALANEATQTAIEQLQTRSLRDMRWLDNARGRLLKQMQKDAKTKRKAVEDEVKAEVRAMPIYAAMRFIRYGELPEADRTNAQRKALDATAGMPTKLDLTALKEMYGEGPAAPWRYLSTGKTGLAAAEGVHPDIVAKVLGFTSGDHLVREIIAAQPEAEVVEGMTDQRVLERYGDLANPDTLARAVDEAIHNEARARFVATELKAISKATGPVRAMTKAAKDFAESLIARKRVRDIKPAQHATAETRAAKAAEKAMRAGDTVTAANEKRNQLVQNYATRTAYNALDEIDKAVKYLRKFDKEGTRKNLDADYLDQIDQLLERFDLRASVTNKAAEKRANLLAWVEAQREQGFEPDIPPELLTEAARKPYRELTLEELRGLVDTVKQIEHLGRLKHKLLTAKDQREFEAARDEIVASIQDNAKKSLPEQRASDRGFLVKMSSLFRYAAAIHRKFSSLARGFDGYKDGGPAWEYLVRNMNERGDFEAVETEKATMALTKLLMPVTDKANGKLTQKQYFPSIGKSFSREERIGMLLNMGNETNLERQLTGERLSPSQLQEVVGTLTKTDAEFVNSVWAFIDSYWPQVAEKERRVTGKAPEKVEAVPFVLTLNNGEKVAMRGGYYPIAYDPIRSERSNADINAEVARQVQQGLYARAQTRRGHTKARTESTGRPLRYDFGEVIANHVTQVIHDLAWHEYLIDANRLLRSTAIEQAVREHYGVEVLQEMKDTLRDIAVGSMGTEKGATFWNHLRYGTTIAGLGFNVFNALQNLTGITQAVSRIGSKWVFKGAAHWAGDAVRFESSVAQIHEKSDFMRLRAKTMQREINDIRNKVAGKDSKLEAAYFYLQAKTQLVVDVPTWWGAYEKAMAQDEMTEDKAVALADQAVIDAQGSGQTKDLAGIQRGGAGMKLFTTFYSFFNTTFNLTAEAAGRTDFKKPGEVALFAADMVLLYSLPALLTTLLKAALMGDWDDEDKLAKKIVGDQISFAMGTVVGLREAAAGVQAALGVGEGFGYTGPASVRFFSDLYNLGKQVQQGEADEAFWKSLNNTTGVLFHYPAGQINRTATGIVALSEGRTENPLAVVMGAPRN